MRIYVPGTAPSVSGQPAAPPPTRGDMGEVYGITQFERWVVGKSEERQVLDVTRADALWRLSIFGELLVQVDYGTTRKRTIQNLRAPVVITVPGQVTVRAKPYDSAHAAAVDCVVTLTQATAGALSQARKAATGPVALDAGAVRFVALDACALTISGVAVSLAASQTVPLVAGSTLTSGSGFQEFEA